MTGRLAERSMSRPRVVFLDVGDTLIRAEPSWAGIYRESLAAAGIHVDEQALEGALLQETQLGGWWTSEDAFEPTEEESFRRVTQFDAAVLARLGHRDVVDEAFRRIGEAFARRSAWYVYPDVAPALEALRAAGIRLCVISNFVWGGVELIHDLELAAHFEALVISARVGSQKPSAAIFEHALAQMHVGPTESLHVGDSYVADVLGARRVGMPAVLIARDNGRGAESTDRSDDPNLRVISDLFELLDLLAIARPAVSAPA